MTTVRSVTKWFLSLSRDSTRAESDGIVVVDENMAEVEVSWTALGDCGVVAADDFFFFFFFCNYVNADTDAPLRRSQPTMLLSQMSPDKLTQATTKTLWSPMHTCSNVVTGTRWG